MCNEVTVEFLDLGFVGFVHDVTVLNIKHVVLNGAGHGAVEALGDAGD